MLQPRIVVDSARRKTSKLHADFEWDDSKAAQLHREEQARLIIRSLRIVHEDDAGEDVVRRVYVHVDRDEDDASGYIDVGELSHDGEAAQQLLTEARNALGQWKRRYEELRAYMPVTFDAIDRELGEPAQAKKKPTAQARKVRVKKAA